MAQRAAIARLIESHGEKWTCATLEVSRHTLARLLSGLNCTKDKLTVVGQKLASLEGRAS